MRCRGCQNVATNHVFGRLEPGLGFLDSGEMAVVLFSISVCSISRQRRKPGILNVSPSVGPLIDRAEAFRVAGRRLIGRPQIAGMRIRKLSAAKFRFENGLIALRLEEGQNSCCLEGTLPVSSLPVSMYARRYDMQWGRYAPCAAPADADTGTSFIALLHDRQARCGWDRRARSIMVGT